MKRIDTLDLIRALTEYAKNQNRPIEEIINNNLPELYEISSNLNGKYHEVDKKISRIENILENLDEKIKYRTNKIFWTNLSIVIGILAGIAGIVIGLISIL